MSKIKEMLEYQRVHDEFQIVAKLGYSADLESAMLNVDALVNCAVAEREALLVKCANAMATVIPDDPIGYDRKDQLLADMLEELESHGIVPQWGDANLPKAEG